MPAEKPRTCSTCPWRRGARAADMPGGFDVAWARSLRDSCREQSFNMPMLTCHNRDADITALCAGWVNDQIREGVTNLRLRMAVIRNRVALPEEPDPDLLSYEELIAQMEADPTAINREPDDT